MDLSGLACSRGFNANDNFSPKIIWGFPSLRAKRNATLLKPFQELGSFVRRIGAEVHKTVVCWLVCLHAYVNPSNETEVSCRHRERAVLELKGF